MPLYAQILICLVALLHFYFLVLEMFLWTKPQGLRTFRMTKEHAAATASLAANQGLYNGFLAAGLVWSLVANESIFSKQIAIYFLACVVIAGAYGGYSVNRRIFFIQALPAILTIICILF